MEGNISEITLVNIYFKATFPFFTYTHYYYNLCCCCYNDYAILPRGTLNRNIANVAVAQTYAYIISIITIISK